MADENDSKTLSAFSRLSRVAPRADFVRKLGVEIGRTARQRVGLGARSAFDEYVIDLRRFVRLLREALTPVQPQPAFRRALNEQLTADALRVSVQRQSKLRWLVIGSVVGSLLSLTGLLVAALFRQRRAPPPNRAVGAT